jgi:hypothetical protein
MTGPDLPVRHYLWMVILGVNLTAFFLPSFADGPNAVIGAVAFCWAPVAGFLTLTGGQHMSANRGLGVAILVTWLANPTFWVGLRLLGKGEWQRAAWMGTLASAFALAIVAAGLAPATFVGYYVWFASMALLAVIGWIGAKRQQPGKRPAFPQ